MLWRFLCVIKNFSNKAMAAMHALQSPPSGKFISLLEGRGNGRRKKEDGKWKIAADGVSK
jgi:hypothetical protein